MVKSTKRCLRKLIARANFSFDELLTALTEIEAVLNSRPLSYISAEDLEEPLTPSHLLVGRRILNLPNHISYQSDPDDEDFTINSVHLTRRVKHLNYSLNQFWNRWRTEYLNELREAHNHFRGKTNNTAKGPRLEVGEVVIVHNERLPRGLWKLGRVQELLKSRDGYCRGVIVKTIARNGQLELLRRPIQLLYPFEICGSSENHITPADNVESEDFSEDPTVNNSEREVAEYSPENPADEANNSSNHRNRVRCVAAQRGDEQRKACMIQLQED